MQNGKRLSWLTIVGLLVFIGSFVNILLHISNLPQDKNFVDAIIDAVFLGRVSLLIVGSGLLILIPFALFKTYDLLFAPHNKQWKLINRAVEVVIIMIFCYLFVVLEHLYWKKEVVFSISELKYFYGWYGVIFFAIVIAGTIF